MSKAKLDGNQLNNCRTDRQRAALHVFAKEADRISNHEKNIVPDINHDLSGMTITITFPEGTTVKRGLGGNENGTTNHKATQNLYGYAFWALACRRLSAMKQWNIVQEHLLEAAKEMLAVGTTSETMEDYLLRTAQGDEKREKAAQALSSDIDNMKANFAIPDRVQETPKSISRPKGKPLPVVEIVDPLRTAEKK